MAPKVMEAATVMDVLTRRGRAAILPCKVKTPNETELDVRTWEDGRRTDG